ncbi:4,5-DOPA-extradiol-dioxygenase [Gilvimarinus sp. F26214L]|uniref:4,5-DOPA-extradiol-dioxygenase n=1 Tax=Gilvimarinus sp. DZF01 TaxID=3461371 RepID=UPI004045AEE5
MTSPMPAVFLGHGTPMNTLDSNRYTEAWSQFGASVPRPRAILAISAHWYINATAITAMARPRTIHDFYGFPQELFDVQYPAPGAPDVAREVAELLQPEHVGLDEDSWGVDHGTWSVLVHAFPEADIPVLQLSINAAQSFDFHLQLGARLAPLRDKGILILCSGNVVHNLRQMARDQSDAAFDWNRRFDEAALDIMTHKPERLPSLQDHPDFPLAVPTDEHFIPLLYLAGLASAAAAPAEMLIQGYAMGSLSMTSYALGCCGDLKSHDSRGAPPVTDVPGEQTNL